MYPVRCPRCGEIINISRERFSRIKEGSDPGTCQACTFGEVYSRSASDDE